MPAVPSYLIECKNCGHCSDLSGCPQAPSNIEGRSSFQFLLEHTGWVDFFIQFLVSLSSMVKITLGP